MTITIKNNSNGIVMTGAITREFKDCFGNDCIGARVPGTIYETIINLTNGNISDRHTGNMTWLSVVSIDR